MNLLLVEPDEIDEDGRLALDTSDERARHLRDVLRVEPGSEVRVGVLNGRRGRARVRTTDPTSVVLTCALSGERPARPRVDLLLALPRPKVLKRLWAPFAALGVGRIVLTNAERVERAYFDSHAVRPEVYRPRLIEGLSQARDTRVPDVMITKLFRPFVEDQLDDVFGETRRIVADPCYRRSVFDVARSTPPEKRVAIAIGPEGGWNAFERELLGRVGFVGAGLGLRPLRSDTATIALLAIVHEALRRP